MKKRGSTFLNLPDPEVTPEEIRCFLGVLILSGYNSLRGKKCYWDSGSDMRNEVKYSAMRRDRFIQIMLFVHCAENANLNKDDKVAKLRPLMDLPKKRCISISKPCAS